MKSNKNIVAIPPGVTIKEQLFYRGMTCEEFALNMGLSEKQASLLLDGKIPLTPKIALNLEKILEIEATFWNNLEGIYREKLLCIEKEKISNIPTTARPSFSSGSVTGI